MTSKYRIHNTGTEYQIIAKESEEIERVIRTAYSEWMAKSILFQLEETAGIKPKYVYRIFVMASDGWSQHGNDFDDYESANFELQNVEAQHDEYRFERVEIKPALESVTETGQKILRDAMSKLAFNAEYSPVTPEKLAPAETCPICGSPEKHGPDFHNVSPERPKTCKHGVAFFPPHMCGECNIELQRLRTAENGEE
jgi:hypothetical protein